MTPSPAPDIPPMPKWSNVKVFLWGAIWAIGGSLGPVAILVYDSIKRYDDPIDWTMIGHAALAASLSAVIGYARKHLALLSPPPEKEPPRAA